jgi:hypothetical protein
MGASSAQRINGFHDLLGVRVYRRKSFIGNIGYF